MRGSFLDDDVLGEHHFLVDVVDVLAGLGLFEPLQIVFYLVELLRVAEVHEFLVAGLQILIRANLGGICRSSCCV